MDLVEYLEHDLHWAPADLVDDILEQHCHMMSWRANFHLLQLYSP